MLKTIGLTSKPINLFDNDVSFYYCLISDFISKSDNMFVLIISDVINISSYNFLLTISNNF